MFLFKRNKKSSASFTSHEVVASVARKWIAHHRRLAIYLQHKSNLLPVRSKKLLLGCFCLLFGGGSLTIVIHAILTQKQTIHLTKIEKVKHVEQSEIKALSSDSLITKTEYDRVVAVKNYLLGLSRDSAGKKQLDSIMQARPKLIDSIALFEELYLSQQ